MPDATQPGPAFVELRRIQTHNGGLRVTLRLAGGRILTTSVPRSQTTAQGITDAIAAAVNATPPPLPPNV